MKRLIPIASFLVTLAGTLDLVAPRTMEACVMDVALLEVEAPHYTLDDLCVAGNNKVTVIIRCASGSRYASQASLSPCLQQPIVTLQYDTKGVEATNITLLLWLNLGHDVLDSASFIFSPVGDSIFSAHHVLGDLQKTRFHLAVAKRCFGDAETERTSVDEAADAAQGGSRPFPNSAFSSLNHLTARHRRDTDATLRPLKTGAQASLALDVSPAILTRDSSPGVETVFIGESFARDENFPVVNESLEDNYFSEFYSKRTKVEPLTASPDETAEPALLGNSVPGNDLYRFGEAVSGHNSTLLTLTSTQITSQPLHVTSPRVTSDSTVTSEFPDANFPVVNESLEDNYFSEFYSKRKKVEPLPASPDETAEPALLGNGEAVSGDNSTLLTLTSTQITSQPLHVTAPRVTSDSTVTSELPENSLGNTRGSMIILNSFSQELLNSTPKEGRPISVGSLTDDMISLFTGALETSDPTYQSATTAGPYMQPEDFTSVSFFEETNVFGNNSGRRLLLEMKDDVTSPEAQSTAEGVTRASSDGTIVSHTSVAGDYSQQDLKDSVPSSSLTSRTSLTSTVAILSTTSDAGTVLNLLENTDTTASPLEFVTEGVNPLGRSSDPQTVSDSHTVSNSQLDTTAQTISDSLTARTESTLAQGPSGSSGVAMASLVTFSSYAPDTIASVVEPVTSLSPLVVSAAVHRPESTVSSQHFSSPTSLPQTSHTPPTDSSPLTTPSTPTSHATDSPTEATSLTNSNASHSPEHPTSPTTTSTSTQQLTHPTVPISSVQPQTFPTIPTPPSQQQTFHVSSSIAPSSPDTPLASPTLPEQDTSSTSSTASSEVQPDVPVTNLFPDAPTSTLPSDLTTNITLETGSRGNSSSWEGPINGSDRGDDTFWPIVAALVIGIPTVIVFGIAIFVIHKRRLASPARLRAASMYPSL